MAGWAWAVDMSHHAHLRAEVFSFLGALMVVSQQSFLQAEFDALLLEEVGWTTGKRMSVGIGSRR